MGTWFSARAALPGLADMATGRPQLAGVVNAVRLRALLRARGSAMWTLGIVLGICFVLTVLLVFVDKPDD